MSQTKDWIYAEHSQEIFRKTEFYSMNWNIENTQLISANFGGPIAFTRDMNKPDIRPFVSICSQSGSVIKSFQLEDKSATLGLGWTSMEDLLSVRENGEIHIHNMFGSLKFLFTIIRDSRVLDFRTFNSINPYSGAYTTGVVVLTSKKKFVIVKDVYEQKLQQFPDIPGSSIDFEAWTVVSTDKKCSVLVAKGTNIYQLNLGGAAQLIQSNFPVQFNFIDKIAVSFTSTHIALATDNGHVLVFNSDFTRLIHKFESDVKLPPEHLAWVSNQAVVAYWDCLLLIPLESETAQNQTEIYGYSMPLFLVQEIDGLRVLTVDKNELLQVVPKSLRDVFGIAAFESSSTLYEASIAFYEDRNQRAEEYIRSIKEKGVLEEAIANCIEAAPHEFETKYQVELLRAALFGRYFDEYANAKPYVQMCQTIRVLNSLRHPQIGLPLTYIQYEALTPPVIINRLISRRHFALAIEICKYLNMNDEDGIIKILSNWALFKVEQNDIDDNKIAVMIKSKLGDTPGIRYSEIARCAISSGRPGLAIKLLEYESKASEQVPLYIEIDNAELALKKAMESGDSDLIYMVLFWYQGKFNNVSDFNKQISKNPVALSLMLQYYRQKNVTDEDTNELSNILNQENLIMEQVISILKVANKQQMVEQKLQLLDEARRLFGSDEKFNSTSLSEEIRLVKIQMIIDKNYKLQMNGKSLYETISDLFKLNILEEAEKLRKEFKISDTSESWWHLKAKSLAKGHLWEELEKFSKSKKSPIGYEPFVNYCMDSNNVIEAKKYYLKVTAPENKFKCLIRMKMLADALDVAFQNKDEHGINMVINKCDNTQRIIIEKAKGLKAQLAGQ